MNLASQAWSAGQLPRAANLLETLRPRAGDADYRGFEWYYLYGQTHPNVVRYWRNDWTTTSDILWSVDGSLMITAARDEPAIRIWEGRTGRFLGNVLLDDENSDKLRETLDGEGWPRRLQGIALSPDGRTLAGTASMVKLCSGTCPLGACGCTGWRIASSMAQGP